MKNYDTLITINKSLCTQCGACIEVCPRGCITRNNNTNLPEAINQAACLNCGHCSSVCFQGALDHCSSPLAKSESIDLEKQPTSQQLESFLKNRRSTRVFTKQEVQEEKIEEVINITSYSPTGGNSQAVDWIIINGREKINKVNNHILNWLRKMLLEKHPLTHQYPVATMIQAAEAGLDPFTRNAPLLVIAKSGEQNLHRDQDVDIALTYFDLASRTKGLGACWSFLVTLAIRQYQPLKKELGITTEYFYTMLVGVPYYQYARYPVRKSPTITNI